MVVDYTACDDESGEEHGCCSNEYLQIDTDDHFAKASFDFQLDYHWIALIPQPWVSAPVAEPLLAAKLLPFERPPPLRVKRQVLFQTFLL